MRRLAWWKVWVDEREQRTPLYYVKSQWQKESKNAAYFLYRLVCGIWFLEALIVSLVDVHYSPQYWPIYYTHWSFLLATAQAVLGLVLVSMNQADAFKPAGGRHQDRACKVYEWIHSAATTQAFCVTILYWTLVYKPKQGAPTFVNVQVHAINSVMMLLDLCVVAFPVRLITFILPFAVSLGYILFNLTYYFAGGTTYDGKTYIYKVLDWSHPETAVVLSVACPVAILLLHSLVWWASYARRLVAFRFHKKRLKKCFQPEPTTA